MVPDPQNLADGSTCAGATAYNQLINWAVTNRNLSVLGQALNIKGFITVGDCVNSTDNNSYNQAQINSVTAYNIAEAATPKMFVARCCGNHDYFNASTINRSQLGYMFRDDKNGAWSPTNTAAKYSGGMDLGSGDVAFYGGTYPDGTYPISTANSYMRVLIQGRKILIISVELFPRSAVLVWARGIHNTYPDHECWITTHGYLHTNGTQFARGDTYSTAFYSMADAPDSNAGNQMWSGSDGTWNGLTTWPNLAMITCGHDIDGYTSGWVWQKPAITSTSPKGQTVHQLFCNCQGQAGTGDTANFCSGNPNTLDGTTSSMHLMLIRIWPATAKVEGFLVSTNTGKYTGAVGVDNQVGPVQLFNITMGSPLGTNGLFPLPMTV
jgi:hypothetical protein